MRRIAPQCKCGIKYTNEQELRVHIALMTSRWPARRCTHEHHDPKSVFDADWLRDHPQATEDVGRNLNNDLPE